MASRLSAALVAVGLSLVASVPADDPAKPAPKANAGVPVALRFAQHFGDPAALTPGKDRELKIQLTAALGKSPALAWDAVPGLFHQAEFLKLTGGTGISTDKMEELLRGKMPRSRADLLPKVRLHAELLTTQFDMIGDEFRKPAEVLAAWVAKNYRPGKPLGAVCICTKNTRRSALSAAMGNVAAAYCGLPGLRFHSGGTAPDAINPRTVATLKEMGLEVEPTGKEAERGTAGEPNPVYRVRWGKGLEAREFSKKHTDDSTPKDGFAALLVCSDADEACPVVVGATARIPLPYLDPKAFDGTPHESAKYAERRDDIGRFMLSALTMARRRLEVEGRVK